MTVKIIPVSEVRQKLKNILGALENTGDPYFITQYSRPKAVLVRYEDYNALVEQAAADHPRIVSRSDIYAGEPIIRGTRVSVRFIVERIQVGQPMEEILAALPHLTPSQVYDALSYYHDHQSEIDQLIEESQPERVIAAQNLRVESVLEGVAVVHSAAGE